MYIWNVFTCIPDTVLIVLPALPDLIFIQCSEVCVIIYLYCTANSIKMCFLLENGGMFYRIIEWLFTLHLYVLTFNTFRLLRQHCKMHLFSRHQHTFFPLSFSSSNCSCTSSLFPFILMIKIKSLDFFKKQNASQSNICPPKYCLVHLKH